jgi:hypothetical protein
MLLIKRLYEVFVYYIPYMILKNQLQDLCKAKLIIEGVEVFFEKVPHKNSWIIKADIHFTCEEMGPGFIEAIESLDFVTIQRCKAHLKAKPKAGYVSLIKESSSIRSFAEFKESMKVFMELFDFWKSVVDDLVKSRGILVF